MRRIEAMAAATQAASKLDMLLICNLGYPGRELYSVLDRPENFYMLGSMGLASSIGLGLALAMPNRRVLSIDGDGAVLMNLGTLATIANHAPSNYQLLIIDNCCYGSTGSQATCTSGKTDLNAIARGAGIEDESLASSPDELRSSVLRGCRLTVARVDPGNEDVGIIDLSPHEIIMRFMERSARTYR